MIFPIILSAHSLPLEYLKTHLIFKKKERNKNK